MSASREPTVTRPHALIPFRETTRPKDEQAELSSTAEAASDLPRLRASLGDARDRHHQQLHGMVGIDLVVNTVLKKDGGTSDANEEDRSKFGITAERHTSAERKVVREGMADGMLATVAYTKLKEKHVRAGKTAVVTVHLQEDPSKQASWDLSEKEVSLEQAVQHCSGLLEVPRERKELLGTEEITETWKITTRLLWYLRPVCDPRLEAPLLAAHRFTENLPGVFGLNKRVLMDSRDSWKRAVLDFNLDEHAWRHKLYLLLKIKVMSKSQELREEGCAGCGVACQRPHHEEMLLDDELLILVIQMLRLREPPAEALSSNAPSSPTPSNQSAYSSPDVSPNISPRRGGVIPYTQVEREFMFVRRYVHDDTECADHELPRTVRLWLEVVEAALRDVPLVAVSLLWTLAATKEMRGVLVEHGVHTVALNLLGVLRLRRKVISTMRVAERKEAAVAAALLAADKVAKRMTDVQKRISQLALKVNSADTSSNDNASEQEQAEEAIAKAQERSMALMKVKQEQHSMDKMHIEMNECRERAEALKAEQEADHGLETDFDKLTGQVTCLLAVLMCDRRACLAIARPVLGAFMPEKYLRQFTDGTRRAWKVCVERDEVTDYDRVMLTSWALAKGCSGFGLLTGLALDEAAHIPAITGHPFFISEVAARALCVIVERGNAFKQGFMDMVGMKTVQEMLDSDKDEVKRCASAVSSSMLTFGQTLPVLETDSAPIMLRFMLLFLNQMVKAEKVELPGRKRAKKSVFQRAANQMVVAQATSRPELKEKLTVCIGSLWSMTSRGLWWSYRMRTNDVVSFMKLMAASQEYAKMMDDVVLVIIAHSFLLLTDDRHTAGILTAEGVDGLLKVSLMGEDTLPAVRMAMTAATVLLLAHNGFDTILSNPHEPPEDFDPGAATSTAGIPMASAFRHHRMSRFSRTARCSVSSTEMEYEPLPGIQSSEGGFSAEEWTRMKGPYRRLLHGYGATMLLTSLRLTEEPRYARMQELVACGLMYLATVGENMPGKAGAWNSREEAATLLELLRAPKAEVVRFAAATAWLAAHQAYGSLMLGTELGVGQALVEVLVAPPWPAGSAAVEVEVSTLQWVAAALWLLVCTNEACDSLDADPHWLERVVGVLSTTFHYPRKDGRAAPEEREETLRQARKPTWFDARVGDSGEPEVELDDAVDLLHWEICGLLYSYAMSTGDRTTAVAAAGAGEFLLELAAGAERGVFLRQRAAELYLFLARGEQASWLLHGWEGGLEEMLVGLLQSGTRRLCELAACTCAQVALDAWRKRTLAQAGAIPALLHAVKFLRPAGGEEEEKKAAALRSLLRPLQALLNLSTDTQNQWLICQHGLRLLLGESLNENNGELLQQLARDIITNLLLNGRNRTQFYKQELRSKSELAAAVTNEESALLPQPGVDHWFPGSPPPAPPSHNPVLSRAISPLGSQSSLSHSHKSLQSGKAPGADARSHSAMHLTAGGDPAARDHLRGPASSEPEGEGRTGGLPRAVSAGNLPHPGGGSATSYARVKQQTRGARAPGRPGSGRPKRPGSGMSSRPGSGMSSRPGSGRPGSGRPGSGASSRPGSGLPRGLSGRRPSAGNYFDAHSYELLQERSESRTRWRPGSGDSRGAGAGAQDAGVFMEDEEDMSEAARAMLKARRLRHGFLEWMYDAFQDLRERDEQVWQSALRWTEEVSFHDEWSSGAGLPTSDWERTVRDGAGAELYQVMREKLGNIWQYSSERLPPPRPLSARAQQPIAEAPVPRAPSPFLVPSLRSADFDTDASPRNLSDDEMMEEEHMLADGTEIALEPVERPPAPPKTLVKGNATFLDTLGPLENMDQAAAGHLVNATQFFWNPEIRSCSVVEGDSARGLIAGEASLGRMAVSTLERGSTEGDEKGVSLGDTNGKQSTERGVVPGNMVDNGSLPPGRFPSVGGDSGAAVKDAVGGQGGAGGLAGEPAGGLSSTFSSVSFAAPTQSLVRSDGSARGDGNAPGVHQGDTIIYRNSWAPYSRPVSIVSGGSGGPGVSVSQDSVQAAPGGHEDVEKTAPRRRRMAMATGGSVSKHSMSAGSSGGSLGPGGSLGRFQEGAKRRPSTKKKRAQAREQLHELLAQERAEREADPMLLRMVEQGKKDAKGRAKKKAGAGNERTPLWEPRHDPRLHAARCGEAEMAALEAQLEALPGPRAFSANQHTVLEHTQPCLCQACVVQKQEVVRAIHMQLRPPWPRNRFCFVEGQEQRMEGLQLEKFLHVEGCRICRGLFDHYTLPTGDCVHLYRPQRQLNDEVEVEPPPFPEPPRGLVSIRQKDLPPPTNHLHELLEEVPMPPPPYKPMPPAPPRPDVHTLKVLHGHRCPEGGASACSEHGRVAAPQIHLVLGSRVEEREVENHALQTWSIKESVFASRSEECHARSHTNMDHTTQRMFDVDWERMINKPNIRKVLRSYGYARDPDNENAAEEMVEEVAKMMSQYYKLVQAYFDFYCAAESTGEPALSSQAFRTFCTDTGILDTRGVPLAGLRDDACAVKVSKGVFLDPNTFRTTVFYRSEVDEHFKKYEKLYRALYEYFKGQDRRMMMGQLYKMLVKIGLHDDHLTPREFQLCFMLARMQVSPAADSQAQGRPMPANFQGSISALRSFCDEIREGPRAMRSRSRRDVAPNADVRVL
ncbi:hypothetical protein CYMTET_23460 [Cymbomonas tetramitiformis]|uniref:Uncharacterized protein n=1 Tax=Cymbomonas tetramitiformis TaxID=36881 RepID=A0AAE0FXW4_9CHLO|nr:hypothetical protein CYMTET_23460 [Cymbomonas tetramitiformis]